MCFEGCWEVFTGRRSSPSSTMTTGSPPRGALIVLCGSGDTGDGIRDWLHAESDGNFEKQLQAVGIEHFVYPNPPVVPYTLAGGRLQGVWFDRKAMAYEAPEDISGIVCSVEQVDAQIDKLVAKGIPPGRIGIVGNSMGGCLSLHVAYGSGRYSGQLGAVACERSFLAEDSVLDEAAAARFKASGAKPSPPL